MLTRTRIRQAAQTIGRQTGRVVDGIAVRPRDFCSLMASHRTLERQYDRELAGLLDLDTGWLFLCRRLDLWMSHIRKPPQHHTAISSGVRTRIDRAETASEPAQSAVNQKTRNSGFVPAAILSRSQLPASSALPAPRSPLQVDAIHN